MSTPARPEDVDEICGSLPETELGISWGDRPTWKVPRGEKGKGEQDHSESSSRSAAARRIVRISCGADRR